ncbi:unnamed protein product [Bemisia tabaci]|uniref:Uncharacterized protein n=1 Tax=Bemisia tabaci TaxID=7038 RepID=A0A9P0F716_BEMTA|nr:unnamed protein product [Bemisia tabaci]
MESMPCEDHFYAALEPVKTYEIKQINIDEAAIISELKSVLGEVPGPIIIGEPGEPLIVRHYAKPYVIEYYERPMVVEHHQKAELNVFTSPPVVIDHYEPVVFQEIQAEPLVTVEEVCPYS